MKEYSPNVRKLMKVSNSPWFARGMALFWTLAAVADYYGHRFTWLSGLVAGLWIVLALAEPTAARIHQRRKNATR